MGVHCRTCTCSDNHPKFCESTVTRYHETFDCLEAWGHYGLHRGALVRLDDECPSCHALETHADNCPQIDLIEDQSKPLAEVQWNDEGSVNVVASVTQPAKDTNQK